MLGVNSVFLDMQKSIDGVLKMVGHGFIVPISWLLISGCADKADPVIPQTGPITPVEVKTSEFSKIERVVIEDRQIDIYLPPNYNPKLSYKVIYFNDGHKLFGTGWHLEVTLDELITTKVVEPLVVVGIYNDADRNNDLIPYDDLWIQQNWSNYSPMAASYSLFIRDKIIPFVEKKYAIREGASNRALAGASLGGLHAMWEGVQSPDYWGLVIAMSPSFWVKEYQIFETINLSENYPSKIWFDIGATTGEWNYYVPVIDILKDKGLVYGTDYFYYEDPDGYHNDASWSKRIIYPLKIFSASGTLTPVSMDIEIEVIKSAQSELYFQRINPIITLNNGVVFSASTQANYELVNVSDGAIQSDGRFAFTNDQDLEVKITYKDLIKTVTVSFSEVQDRKM